MKLYLFITNWLNIRPARLIISLIVTIIVLFTYLLAKITLTNILEAAQKASDTEQTTTKVTA